MRRSDYAPTLVLLATVIWVALPFTGPAWGNNFTVNTTLDLPDETPGNGECKSAPPEELCSLRAAIMEANAWRGADDIRLPAATYVLSIPPGPVDTDAGGDLDITGDLDIHAPSSALPSSTPTAWIACSRSSGSRCVCTTSPSSAG